MSESKSFFDSPEWKALQDAYKESASLYEKDCNDFWEGLSYEDKLKAFYSVCKRLYKGEIQERRSYRGVLYDVFQFDMDSYGVGMECGYMDLHNAIYPDGKPDDS